MQLVALGLFVLTFLSPAMSYSHQSAILYVNRADPTCGGEFPCFTRIQSAITAAKPGNIVRIQAGTYTEQVTISNKNTVGGSTELHRIVIEADPGAPAGSVVLRGHGHGRHDDDGCGEGDDPHYGFKFRNSRFVTLRDLTITGFTGPAVWLAPGGGHDDDGRSGTNVGIHIELNRIYRNISSACGGGIAISRGNSGTLIVNNLIYANGGSGITFEGASGGPHYVINNVVYENQRNGVDVSRGQQVHLVNNIINRNGTVAGATGGRYGVRRESSSNPQPQNLRLFNNLVCGNARGEINGPALDGTDSGNFTPLGNEGPGVFARPGCEIPANIFADLNGADGLSNTADDDFSLKRYSFAADIGMDPRALGLDPAFDAIFLVDYFRDTILRPQDGDGDGIAQFDAGAFEFFGDFNPPQLTFQSPSENAHVRQTIAVTVQVTDNDAVAALTLQASGQTLPSATFSALLSTSTTGTALWNTTTVGDGTVVLSATATDREGNIGGASRAVIVDNTPPDTQIISGPAGQINQTTATFAFAGLDNLTPNGNLVFAWRIDGGAFTSFGTDATATVASLTAGSHTFEVIARDLAGNVDPIPASHIFTSQLGPTITDIDPPGGRVGALVSITGNDFEPGATQVTFNGIAATLREITATSITTTVPFNSTTGPLTVATSRGSTSRAFMVNTNQDFILAANPASVQTVQGNSAAVLIDAIPIAGFSGMVQLTAGLLPAGISAKFSPSTLASNNSSILTLTTTSATPDGAHVVEVQATAQIDGQTVTRTGTVTLNITALGQTVLVGQILDGDDRPLPGVSIKLGGAALTHLGFSDAAGNLFIPLSVSGPQVFLIDGSTANTPATNYSTIPITLDLEPSIVNKLGYIPRLRGQPVAKLTPIVPGQATVITDPDLPGFKMTIPAGVQIIGWDGQPNTLFGVTTVPIDRSPLPPLPSGLEARQTHLFSFGKVGGGNPTGNIPIDTANDVGGLPGEKIDLYYFNEAPDGTAPNQWEKYGTGTVSSDATAIITDINPATGLPYGIPRFCCGARTNVRPPNFSTVGGGRSGGPRDGGKKAGDPVDTATGFFYLDKTDMVLSGRLPIAITRTYRTNLTNPGPFGIGTSWPFDVSLSSPPNGSGDTLILVTPGNRQDVFSRQSFNTFVNTTSPWLRGAVLAVDILRLRFKDGAIWQFDSAGRLQSKADRNGNIIQISRDGQGRVVRIGLFLGGELTVDYTGAGIASITDAIGRQVHYSYDAQGRLDRVTDSAGGITSYTYDSEHKMLTVTDARGITYLTNEYDAEGRVVRQTQADGGVWTFEYTGNASFISQTTVTDPRGQVTTYRLNAAGYQVSETDALGRTTILERQAGTNLVSSVTDVLKRSTRFEYDSAGNVTRMTDPANNVRYFTYNPTYNRVTVVTDPLGQVTRFEHDGLGNLTATFDPLGNRTTIAYNRFGQPASVTDPLGNVSTFAYDNVGNLTAISDPLGNNAQRTYDAVSRLTSQTNPRGKKTSFVYDALDRLIQITDAASGSTQFGYDGNGNLLSVVDVRGSVTAYTYDNMDRLVRRIDPLGAVESYQYDVTGNLTAHIDRKGQLATYSYDPLNRRSGGSHADGASTTFVYDAVGRLIQATDSTNGTIANHYDILNRLTEQISNLGTVSYEYNAIGRRTRMNVPGQSPVTYAYDAASRLRQIVQGANVVGFDYDALGRRTNLTLPNGVSTEYQYDPASRLTALLYRNALGIMGDLTYEYDKAGNRTGVGGSFARTLLPDPVDLATYDAANRQLALGVKTMTNDANGNLISISEPSGTTIYQWDARNRMVGLAGPGHTASFTYDALGRRSGKTVDSQRVQYFYDGLNPAQETSGASVLANTLTGLGIDEYLARTDSTGARFFLSDALGSSVALADSTGTVQTDYIYEPFGKTSLSGAFSSNPFQYTGRENDGKGLYYYRARYYYPGLQRFGSEDPLSVANLHVHTNDELRQPISLFLLQDQFKFGDSYGYVGNNPLLFDDPLGLAPNALDLINGVVLGAAGAAIENGIEGNGLEATVGGLFGGLAGLVPVAGVHGAIVGGIFGFGSGIATEAVGNPNPSLGDLVIGGIAGAVGGAAGGAIGGYRGAVVGTGTGIYAKRAGQRILRCYVKKKC
ncbi:MAG TPA: DUF6531 domain-containing protein [Candidatus Binatia bacterium]